MSLRRLDEAVSDGAKSDVLLYRNRKVNVTRLSAIFKRLSYFP